MTGSPEAWHPALNSYHSTFGHFPDATPATREEPERSWRIDLLPFFEFKEIESLTHRYNNQLPWNDPENRATNTPIDSFRSPFDTSAGPITNYVAVGGDGFVFNKDGPVKISQIADGTSKTILLVEYVPSTIRWAEPRDLTFDEYAACFAANHHPYGGFLVLFADGTTSVLSPAISKEQLHALFTYNGKEAIEPEAP